MRVMKRVLVFIGFVLPILTEGVSLQAHALPSNWIAPVSLLCLAQVLVGLSLCIRRVEEKIGMPLVVFGLLLTLVPFVWFWRFVPLLVSEIVTFVILGGIVGILIIGGIAVLAAIVFFGWIFSKFGIFYEPPD